MTVGPALGRGRPSPAPKIGWHTRDQRISGQTSSNELVRTAEPQWVAPCQFRYRAPRFQTNKTDSCWLSKCSLRITSSALALRILEWSHRKETLVVCGPSATGRTFLPRSLGQQAVEEGMRVAALTSSCPNPRHRDRRPAPAPRPRLPNNWRFHPPHPGPGRKGRHAAELNPKPVASTPHPELGQTSWPPLGSSTGQWWAEMLANYGHFPMAVDSGRPKCQARQVTSSPEEIRPDVTPSMASSRDFDVSDG